MCMCTPWGPESTWEKYYKCDEGKGDSQTETLWVIDDVVDAYRRVTVECTQQTARRRALIRNLK